MKSQHAGASKLICLWILLNSELWGDLSVNEIWIEDIEFVALDHLQVIYDAKSPGKKVTESSLTIGKEAKSNCRSDDDNMMS